MALVPYNGGGVYTTRSSSFPGVYRGRGTLDRDLYRPSPEPYGAFDSGFPFMGVRIIGGILLVLAVLVLVVGIVAVALNVPMDEKDGTLLIFGAISMTAITALATATGVIGILHSEYRHNLEAYRNSFQTLCVLTACLCIIQMVTMSVYHARSYGNEDLGLLLTDGGETNSAIWITLTVFIAIVALVASIGSFLVCCMPGLCTPIVDNDAYVYSYDRRDDFGDLGFLNFLGIGNRGRYYDDGPTRVYNSRYPSRGRYYDDADYITRDRYVTKPRGRYY